MSETARRQRHVEVSCVVQIDALSAESATQLESSIVAFVHGIPGRESRCESIAFMTGTPAA
jgi:hypothetical protein